MVGSAVMDGPCDGLADGVAESGEVFFNSNQHNQQRLSITTALKWIREHLSPMLQGFNPTDQNNLDKVLSDFFMARYLEYNDSLNREEEDELKNESVSEALTPAPAKDKKGGDKGKKGNSTEKPLPPAETPVPRLPGATAVGVVSLAVPRTAARLLGEPLYRHIRSVTVPQAQNETHLPALMIIILNCGKNSVGKFNLLEEFILMPSSSQRVREVIGMGLELQCEMRRVLNGSAYKAGSRGKYEVISGCHKSPDELVDIYECLINKYPAITSLIDPFRKETVGSGVSFLKLGGFRGRKQMDKYNGLMAIEEELEQEGILGAREKKTASGRSFHTFNSGSGCDSVTIST